MTPTPADSVNPVRKVRLKQSDKVPWDDPMLPHLIHAMLLYLVPVALGGTAGVLVRRATDSMPVRVLAAGLTVLATIQVQYGLFFAISHWMTETTLDPESLTPGALVSGILWFALVASFTSVPLAAMAYLGGLFVPARSGRKLGDEGFEPPTLTV